jgi:sporulation protein YlmC with PRC-barrel domain
MLKTKRISDSYSMNVYTDDGFYFGDIEESIISSNKVSGWRIKATKGSKLSQILSGAKGVIVPHQYVKAFGDIVIISNDALPNYEDESDSGELEEA